ncbi:MAG: LamG domain-containing protein [Thermoplasmata archaeon]|nr:MAG: LamG domain-containing protein [Thermoplasmata archaeon]
MKPRKTGIFFVAVLLAMMFAVAVPGSVSAEGTCPEGPVSYWRFDEGAGDVAVDSTGANEGTIYGAAWTTGRAGGALYFDGIDDYVYIPTVNGMDVGTGDITLEAWIKSSSGSLEQMVFNRQGAQYYTIRMGDEVTAGRIGGGVGGPIQFSGGVYNDDHWHHVVCARRSGTMEVYVDTFLVASGPNGGDVNGNYPYATIASAAGTVGFFKGSIDEVAIWDRALEPSEIVEHHENGLSGKGYCESGGSGEYVDVEVELEEITFKAEIDRDSIEVMFNPGKLNFDRTVPWKDHHLTGTPKTEFTNGKPFKLKMDIFVDESGVEGGDINLAIFAFEHYIALNEDVKKPELIKFDWGTLKFDAILEDMDVTYELFKPDGTPLRAKMSCTFTEYSPASEQLKQAPRH